MCWPGRNGAGKSTLIRTLTGVSAPDSGSIAIDGRDALADRGLFGLVAYVPQELNLFAHMSVAENLFMPFGRSGLGGASFSPAALNRAARPLPGPVRHPRATRPGGRLDRSLGPAVAADRPGLHPPGLQSADPRRTHVLADRVRDRTVVRPDPADARCRPCHRVRLAQDGGDVRDRRQRHRAAQRTQRRAPSHGRHRRARTDPPDVRRRDAPRPGLPAEAGREWRGIGGAHPRGPGPGRARCQRPRLRGRLVQSATRRDPGFCGPGRRRTQRTDADRVRHPQADVRNGDARRQAAQAGAPGSLGRTRHDLPVGGAQAARHPAAAQRAREHRHLAAAADCAPRRHLPAAPRRSWRTR